MHIANVHVALTISNGLLLKAWISYSVHCTFSPFIVIWVYIHNITKYYACVYVYVLHTYIHTHICNIW